MTMPTRIRPEQVMQSLETLGLLARFHFVVQAARSVRDLPAVQSLLKAFKIEAEARYRDLAFECHPDHGGDEERMQEINAAWDIVKILDVRPRPRPQPVCNIRVVVYNSGTSATWNGGTGYTTTDS